MLDEAIDQRDLGRLDAALRLVDVEPLDPVDLRKRLEPPGARRPDHLERVAVRRRRVEVALEGPGVDGLAALLDDAAQLDRVAVRWAVAGLLLELAPGDGDELLVTVGLALGDRPVAGRAVREERPARVGEQDLEPTIPRPEEDDAGACPWCHDPTTIADLREASNPAPPTGLRPGTPPPR